MTRTADLLGDVDVRSAGRGPVVALAHGAGGGVAENFADLIETGADRFRFVGPQMPGVGSTPLPQEPVDLEQMADRVVAAAVRAGGEQFPIVGTSLGAAVALTAAVRHLDRVSALVLTVPFARPDAQSGPYIAVWRALHAAGEWDALAQHLLVGCTTTAALTAMSETEVRTATSEIREGYPAGGAAHAELAAGVDVSGLFEQVNVPSLVIVGGQDRLLLPSTCRSYAAIPGAQVLDYPDAGHIFDGPTTQRWSADVLGFLEAKATSAQVRTA